MDIQSQVIDHLKVEVPFVVETLWAESDAVCGSEIEKAFLVSSTVLLRGLGVSVRWDRSLATTSNCMFIEPQVAIDPYRVDFLVGNWFARDDMLKAVVVECDGHDWHERTKEQSEHDKRRDRFLSMKVGRVLRFTGSEIYRTPSHAIVEVINVLSVVGGLERSTAGQITV